MTNDSPELHAVNPLYDSFFLRCDDLRRQQPGAWCCAAVDLQNFKLFNEVYGRERGNALLSAITGILRRLEETGAAASVYLGRDDFLVCLPYDRPVLEHLLDELRSAVSGMADTLGFLPAIGVYCLNEGEAIDLDVCDKAVEALADAKKSPLTRLCEYDRAVHEKERSDHQLLADLKQAIDRGEVTFYLQPQCRISTRRIVGAEVLARWLRADGTLIPPGTFIPVLERQGFVTDFDRLIWEQAFAWLHSLRERGISPVPVSINVSQRDLLLMDVAAFLCALCDKYDVPSSLIKVELTETSYAEAYDIVQPFVKVLGSKGFTVMMDDFGSGYSSLNMLENVAVDVLKLDMNFMKDTRLYSRKGVTIIESIVHMSKMMSLPIVVEGVETAEQVEFLRNLGCRYAQGYHFYRPMPIARFEELLCQEEMLDRRGLLCKRNDEFHVREFIDENTFTDSMLNNILGAVAFYALDGKDLTITRFNEQFYRAIGDASMETRQIAIQNYVVREDWPSLYRALDEAHDNLAVGGTCEIRFYKSDGGVFWFRMHFFFLKNEEQKRIYYGQVEDVTELRMQSMQFLEVLREQSDVSMIINLDRQLIQYVTNGGSLSQLGLPSLDLGISTHRTAESRIEDPAARTQFTEFFNVGRLREAHRHALYHETLTIPFRLTDQVVPVEFSTYYIRYTKDQELTVYVFARQV